MRVPHPCLHCAKQCAEPRINLRRGRTLIRARCFGRAVISSAEALVAASDTRSNDATTNTAGSAARADAAGVAAGEARIGVAVLLPATVAVVGRFDCRGTRRPRMAASASSDRHRHRGRRSSRRPLRTRRRSMSAIAPHLHIVEHRCDWLHGGAHEQIVPAKIKPTPRVSAR